MDFFLLASLILSAQDGPSNVSADQFTNIMRAAYAEVRDVSFIYEGEVQLVREGATEEERTDRQERYQGSYAFRADGSTYLDVYLNSGPDNQLFRSKAAILRDKMELVSFAPDSSRRGQIEERTRNFYALEDNSPQRFLFYWYFGQLTDARSLEYEFQGWEEVDGRKCLRVKLGWSPREAGSPAVMPEYRFWIDVERGGHPVRVDRLIQPPHVAASTRIELQRFQLPNGKPVWFPVNAVSDVFLRSLGKYSPAPVIRETYSVVRSTLRFNKGLPDSMFSVRKDASISGSAGLPLRKEFAEAALRPPPRLPTDPESMRKILDAKLAEADRQSRMIAASSTARVASGWSGFAPLALVVAGLALVAVAAVLLWRRGAR